MYRTSSVVFVNETSLAELRGNTYAEHCHTVDDFGETKVSYFDDRWVVLRQQHILWLQVSVGDALTVDVLHIQVSK